MTVLRRNLEQIWDQLRSQKPGRSNSLEEVTVRGLRGVGDLRVPLAFPVTVLAGANGCGKSTVLMALACAYKVPGAGSREFTPAAVFPDFAPPAGAGSLADARANTELIFSYVAEGTRRQMRWARGVGKWNRSFFGTKGGRQPERAVFLRTLANLTNPSEVRSVLQLAQRRFQVDSIDASSIAFAQRILSFRYKRLSRISGAREKSLLFAEREEGPSPASYSEFHMAAGERSLLRLSVEISKYEDALVLIDEVEAGLHPYVQQILLLELQRLALRNRLQIVVTTHSPVVLDTVPPEARVFLERSGDKVVRREAFRDLIQRALYGRALETLSFLCEDDAAEALLRGVLDDLGPEIDLTQNDIDVGRDSGKDQFRAHLETFAHFKRLDDVVFVLDGDGASLKPALESRARELSQAARILVLPGSAGPEQWIWERLQAAPERHAPGLGSTAAALQQRLADIDRVFESAADRPAAIAKNKLFTFASELSRTLPEVVRVVARTETAAKAGEAHRLRTELHDVIGRWRSLAG
jgi:predicted ATPase